MYLETLFLISLVSKKFHISTQALGPILCACIRQKCKSLKKTKCCFFESRALGRQLFHWMWTQILRFGPILSFRVGAIGKNGDRKSRRRPDSI